MLAALKSIVPSYFPEDDYRCYRRRWDDGQSWIKCRFISIAVYILGEKKKKKLTEAIPKTLHAS